MTSFFNHLQGRRGGVEKIELDTVRPLMFGVATSVWTKAEALSLINERLNIDGKSALTAEAQAELNEVLDAIEAAVGFSAKIQLWHAFEMACLSVEAKIDIASTNIGGATPLFDIGVWRIMAGVSDHSSA